MTITFPVTPPVSPLPDALDWDNFDANPFTQDPFTGQTQTQEFFDQISVDVSLPPMEIADAARWIGFLIKLRGRVGSFLWGDDSWTLQGAAGGTPLVNGASQTGLTLITDGWPNSTLVLKEADVIQIGAGATAELKRVTADATTNGSGQVTIDIWPQIRTSPGDNTAIVTSSPKGLFRLSDNRRGWKVNEAIHFGIQFRAEEFL